MWNVTLPKQMTMFRHTTYWFKHPVESTKVKTNESRSKLNCICVVEHLQKENSYERGPKLVKMTHNNNVNCLLWNISLCFFFVTCFLLSILEKLAFWWHSFYMRNEQFFVTNVCDCPLLPFQNACVVCWINFFNLLLPHLPKSQTHTHISICLQNTILFRLIHTNYTNKNRCLGFNAQISLLYFLRPKKKKFVISLLSHIRRRCNWIGFFFKFYKNLYLQFYQLFLTHTSKLFHFTNF